jgi:YD repeat-containing protein
MARLLKRVFIPLLIISTLIVSVAIIYVINNPNAPVTVYCVTEINSKKRYQYDEKGRLLGKIQENGQINTSYTYDDNGNPTTFNYNGYKATATYDDNGNILTREYKKGSKQWRDLFNYDEQGKLIKTESWEGDTLVCTETHEYDTHGRLIYKAMEYSPGSEYNNYFHYAYDFWGNLTEYKIYYGDRLRHEYTYAYDYAGRIIAEEEKLDGNVESKSEYSYDLFGRLIRQESQSPGIMLEWVDQTAPKLQKTEHIYKYDLYGNLLERTIKYESGETSSVLWTYDRRGNIASWAYATALHKFTTDIHGNIIEQKIIYNEDVSSTTTYAYVPYRTTRKDAELIKEQQAEILSFPVWEATPKTVLEKE